MYINSLRTAFFRNLADAEIFTGAKDVFLVGENGQGKTNFIEALYFCAYASSFREIKDSEIARNGEKSFSSEVRTTKTSNKEILVKVEKGKKSVIIDGKKIEDRKDLLSVIPCVIFCHEDMEFISGSPERRRWFFDQVLSLYDPVYLDDLRCYRHVLKSRNKLLRDFSQNKFSDNPGPLLDALDPQLVMYGIKLMEKRETAVNLFSEIFGSLYEKVAGISGIKVQYASSWKKTNKEQIIAFLGQRRTAEISVGISMSGPHRDKYEFAHNETEFTGKASTGQRRLLALLLRVAQAFRFTEVTGKNPVILLDDVLLEMDGEKRRKFISVLPGYDQAFYTFLPEEPYWQYCKEDTLVYNVNAGQLSKKE